MPDRSNPVAPQAFAAWAPGCILFLAPNPVEEAAARAEGLDVAHRVGDVADGRRVLVRPRPEGLALAGFQALEDAFRARGPNGPRLATPTVDVARAARVAGWLDTLRDLAPEARLIPAVLAHRVEAARARLGWETARLTDDLGRSRTALDGDGVLWRGADDPESPAVRRFGLWHQYVWAAPDATDAAPADEAAQGAARRVARRFWHPFFAVTVGPREGDPEAPWRLLGLTDGQLAGPAGCGLDAPTYYRHLAAGLDPRRTALAAAMTEAARQDILS